VAVTRCDAQYAPRLTPSLSQEPSPVTMPASADLTLADQGKRSLWPLSGVFGSYPRLTLRRLTNHITKGDHCALHEAR
jgi:hypothetical protein